MKKQTPHVTDKQDFYTTSFAKGVFGTAPKYQFVLDLMRQWRPKTFLDIGCGDGQFAAVIKNELKLHKAYGIEIAAQGVRNAKKLGVDGICLDIDQKNIPLPSGSVDVIFCGEIIEHVYSSDHLLEEIYRLLRPKGKLIITTPNLSAWYNRLSILFGYQPIFSDVSLKYSVGHLFPMNTSFGHLRIYTLFGLTELLRLHKFSIRSTYGFGVNERVGVGKAFSWVARMANWVFRHPSWSSDLCVVASKG